MIGPILRRAAAGRLPSRREVMLMMQAEGTEYQALLETANRLCRDLKGEQSALRGLVTFSDESEPEVALQDAVTAWRFGCSSVLIQGDELTTAVDEVAALIQQIRKRTDLQIALCMGERAYDVYANWRQAGADEYVLPHECCNPHLYAQLYPGRSPAERLTRYLWLRGLGFRVTGGIRLGLAGQGAGEIADELEVLRNAEVTGVMLRPMSEEGDVLRVTAITRLCLPQADIMVSGDDPALQAQVLACGANLLTATSPEGHADLGWVAPVLAPML